MHDDRVVFPTSYLAALAARVVARLEGSWSFARVKSRGIATLTVDCTCDRDERSVVCSVNLSDIGHAYIPAVFDARRYGERAVPRPIIEFSNTETVRLRASRLSFITGMRAVVPSRLPIGFVFSERRELGTKADELALDDHFQFVAPNGQTHPAFSATNLPVPVTRH